MISCANNFNKPHTHYSSSSSPQSDQSSHFLIRAACPQPLFQKSTTDPEPPNPDEPTREDHRRSSPLGFHCYLVCYPYALLPSQSAGTHGPYKPRGKGQHTLPASCVSRGGGEGRKEGRPLRSPDLGLGLGSLERGSYAPSPGSRVPASSTFRIWREGGKRWAGERLCILVYA